MPLTLKTYGMLIVMLGDGANAVVGQEFGFIEHARQQPLHAMAAQQRQQTALAAALLVPVRHQGGEFRAVFQEPFQAALEFRHLVEQFGLQRFDREQRDQTRPSSAP